MLNPKCYEKRNNLFDGIIWWMLSVILVELFSLLCSIMRWTFRFFVGNEFKRIVLFLFWVIPSIFLSPSPLSNFRCINQYFLAQSRSRGSRPQPRPLRDSFHFQLVVVVCGDVVVVIVVCGDVVVVIVVCGDVVVVVMVDGSYIGGL